MIKRTENILGKYKTGQKKNGETLYCQPDIVEFAYITVKTEEITLFFAQILIAVHIAERANI